MNRREFTSKRFGGRRLRTRVLAYDAPTLVGSETVFSDDPGDAETSGR